MKKNLATFLITLFVMTGMLFSMDNFNALEIEGWRYLSEKYFYQEMLLQRKTLKEQALKLENLFIHDYNLQKYLKKNDLNFEDLKLLLIACAIRNHLSHAKKIIQQARLLKKRNPDSRPFCDLLLLNEALFFAAEGGHAKMVKFLLKNGAFDQYTALCWAAEKGRADIVNILMQAGARWPDWPLCNAARNGHIEAAAVLLANGAKNKIAAINMAIEHGQCDMVHFLLEGATDQERYHALYIATVNGNMPLVMSLIDDSVLDEIMQLAKEHKKKEIIYNLTKNHLLPSKSSSPSLQKKKKNRRIIIKPPLKNRPTIFDKKQNHLIEQPKLDKNIVAELKPTIEPNRAASLQPSLCQPILPKTIIPEAIEAKLDRLDTIRSKKESCPSFSFSRPYNLKWLTLGTVIGIASIYGIKKIYEWRRKNDTETENVMVDSSEEI